MNWSQTNGNGAEGGTCMMNTLQLKLARAGAEMSSIGHRLEDGASAVNTREGDGVTTPVDLNTLLLQGEEGNQGTDSDGAGEGSGGDAGSVHQHRIRNQA